MVIHVLPIDDIEDHIDSSTCPCQPSIEEENGHLIIVHSSFDGREGVEWAQEILNERNIPGSRDLSDKG